MDMVDVEKEIAQYQRHSKKIFVACHYPDDAYYGNRLTDWFGADSAQLVRPNQTAIDFSIDPYLVATALRESQLKDSSLTVLLLGAQVWRKYLFDWVIYASLLPDTNSMCSRVVGVLLPTHPDYYKERYSPHLLPPRLYDNLVNKVALLVRWSDNREDMVNFLQQQAALPPNPNPILTRSTRLVDLEGSGWVE